MKIYDTMMFLNEVDLLEIRLNVMNEIADYFVIVEANATQMGEPREQMFPKVRDRFKQFEDKIVYYVCDCKDMEFESQWKREPYQKNQVIQAITDANDDDIVMYSDLDEFPNPEKIKEIIASFNPDTVYHFVQRMYNFYLNYENVGNYLLGEAGDFEGVEPARWLGTRLCTAKLAREINIYNLRVKNTLNNYPAVRVENGGWHFSYMGGSGDSVKKRVKDKLKSFSHNEFNNPRLWSYIHIYRKVLTGRDFLGRDARFAKVPIDDKYPKWIQEHYKEYPHFVLK